MERRIFIAGVADRISVVSVIGVIIAVEEHFHLVYAAIQQTVNTPGSRVMICAEFVDQILFSDVIEVATAVVLTVKQCINQFIVTEQRSRAAIVGKAHQSIILLLVKLDVVIEQEVVDA